MTFKSILKRRFFGPETGLSFIHYGGENPFFSWLKDGKKMAADIRTGTKKGKRVFSFLKKNRLYFTGYYIDTRYKRL